MAANQPHQKKPCKDCPFRKDAPAGWLNRSIERHLDADTFVCHKTTSKGLNDRLQCAGHMLLMGPANQFVRMASMFGIALDLTGRELVFDTPEECIQHHKKAV